MSKVYVVYDPGCTVVRGVFSEMTNAESFIEKGISETREKFEREDVVIYTVTLDQPIDIGYA